MRERVTSSTFYGGWGTAKLCVGVIFAAACFACENGTTNAVPRNNGEPCALNADCSSQYCVPEILNGSETQWPDGICTEPCVDDGCGLGQSCVPFDGIGLCLVQCTSTAPACRDGYVCHPDLQVCLPDCRTIWDCGSRFVCDESSGACALPSTPGAGLGEACVDSFDCISTICLVAEDDRGEATGWAEGMCSAPCPDGDCGPDGTCIRMDAYLLCVPACAPGATSCREGYVCNSEVSGCLPDCRSDWPCGEGFECGASGECTLLTPPVSALGESCSADYECETGICLLDGWPGGSCAGICGAIACGPDARCVSFDGDSYCLANCATNSDCRDEYVCGPASVCMPDCRSGFDCGVARACDPDSGACISVMPTGLSLGAACTESSQCESQSCLVEASAGFDVGICTQVCADYCQGGFLCRELDELRYCLPSCSAGCPDRFLCRSDVCVPDCLSGWPCPSGQVCNLHGLCRLPGPGAGPGGR